MLRFFKRKKDAETAVSQDNEVDVAAVDTDIPASTALQNANEPVAEDVLSTDVSDVETVSEAQTSDVIAETVSKPEPITDLEVDVAAEPEEKNRGFFSRLKKGLSRTRQGFAQGVARVILGKQFIDDELLEDIETQLLLSDVGVDATLQVIDNLEDKVARKQLSDPAALLDALKQQLFDILAPCEAPLVLPKQDKPFVLLMVGVNGAGKTTTIGKIAKKYQSEGKKVMLAAGDTFRAAAVEQLQVWGERNNVPVIAQHTGADSASVIYDAVQAATARNVDILIADTAGRLHTQSNLMEELKKVRRVITKLDDTAPHEIMLVLDSTAGQNALIQAKQFRDAVGVSGITMTKLDGSAKGGIVFAIADHLKLPLRFIGVGEGIDDLRPFAAKDFIDALFTDLETNESTL